MIIDEALVGAVIDIADAAGRAIMEVYEGPDFEVEKKADDSPLTVADKRANAVIIKALEELTPHIPILSEESKQVDYEERKGWSRFWLVDPLDGTKEFIKRNGEFTVNIALVEGGGGPGETGSPVFGVVHGPAVGTTYWGIVDEGAYKKDKGGEAMVIKAGGYEGGPVKVVASRSHGSTALDGFLEKVGTHERVSMGSSLKLCLVADGTAHIYPRLGPTMEWDTAAANAVVLAAGGRVTDLEGRPLRYNKEDLLNPFFIVTGSPSYRWRDKV